MKIAVPFEGQDEERVRRAAAEHKTPASVAIRALVNHALADPVDPIIQRVLADAAEAERTRRRAAGRSGMHARWGDRATGTGKGSE